MTTWIVSVEDKDRLHVATFQVYTNGSAISEAIAGAKASMEEIFRKEVFIYGLIRAED